MEATNFDVHFEGPFGFLPLDGLQDVFNCTLSGAKGIYLWTVQTDVGFLTNYVGETGAGAKTFASRLAEQVQFYLSGQDDMVDPDEFVRGVRTVVLKRGDVRQFLSGYPAFAESIHRVLRSYRLFLVPLDGASLEQRKRIESAIIRDLRNAGDRSRQFLANRRCSPLPQPSISVNIVSPVEIHGLSEHLLA